jgi:replication factor C subunit 1
MSPFECASKLLDPRISSTNPNIIKPTSARIDMYFTDGDLVPLLLQENYLNHIPQYMKHGEAAWAVL